MKRQHLFIFMALCLFPLVTKAQGSVDQAKLSALLSAAEKTHSESVIIYQNNQLVTEKYFGLGSVDKKIEAMSCTKSIVGLAVACMLSDGLLEDINTPVHQFYPEWNQGRKKLITVKHLVHMSSGIQNVPNASLEIYPSPDFVQLALAAELSHEPGEVFSYNNKSLNLMAGVIEKITGKRMDQYIGERLFAPLGITDFTWTLDDAGNPHVMAGCQIRPADFAKLGLLVINQGLFQGKEIIKAQMIEAMLKASEQSQVYGMLWWLDYENTVSIIDDSVIEGLSKAGVDKEFTQALAKAKGRYNSQQALIMKMMEVLGPDARQKMNQALAGKPVSFRKREFSGKVRYRADGYLGNYIIIDPATKIVAIRMISHDSHERQQDNFESFSEMVYGLTKSH